MNLTGLLQRSVWTHSACQNLSKCFSRYVCFLAFASLKASGLAGWRGGAIALATCLGQTLWGMVYHCVLIFESTWTLKPGIVASNVEQCILWGLLVPGLFHAFWASAIALHCLAETLDFFWNESGGHRVSGASAGAPSTLVALQFFGPLRRLTSHYLIASSFWESAARCRHFWVQERPITDLYDLLFDIIYIFFIAFIENSLIMWKFARQVLASRWIYL